VARSIAVLPLVLVLALGCAPPPGRTPGAVSSGLANAPSGAGRARRALAA
jgi:hypothetical protein